MDDSKFWSQVNKNGNNGCWEWTGRLNAGGYGSVKRNGQQLAHRISWIKLVGGIGDMHVLHKCDNPKCVNPDHLFLGTNADNIADSTNKKRRVKQKGELNHNRKINQSDVDKIRELYNPCPTMSELAKMFGISKTEVGRIIRRESWA